RGPRADLADGFRRQAAEERVLPVRGQGVERRQGGRITDVAEREDRVAAHRRVDVAREEVHDRPGRTPVADLAEAGEDAPLGAEVGVAHEELLDEERSGVLGLDVAQCVDRLDPHAHVEVTRGRDQGLGRLRIVHLPQGADGVEALLDVLALELAHAVAQLLAVLRLAVAVAKVGPGTVLLAEGYDAVLRERERRQDDGSEREPGAQPRAGRHRAESRPGRRGLQPAAGRAEISSARRRFLLEAARTEGGWRWNGR